MFDKIKSPILLLVVLILVSLSLAGGVFYLLQKERAKSVTLQEELGEIKVREKAAEVKLEDAKKVIKEFVFKLQESESQIKKINDDLAQERSAKEEAIAMAEQLKTDLEQQKSLRTDLEKKFSQAQQDLTKIQGDLKEFSSKKIELEKKIKTLEAQALPAQSESVELGKVVVTPEGAVFSSEKAGAVKQPAASEGKVLVVNKDYGFAVLSLGSKDGIELGNIFSVYHGNKIIGDLKVEKVHDSMSAAGFLTSGMQDKVIEGDRVVRKTKP